MVEFKDIPFQSKKKVLGIEGLTSQVADIVKVIKPTGTGNDSTNINAILSSGNKKFVFKYGTYNIQEDILVKSNSVLEFEEGAVFKKNATSSGIYNVMLLKDSSNVTLINPTIIGDRVTHTGTTGEWGHGITLQGTTNVKIQNAKVRDCWGDGIYIGATPQGGTRFCTDTWFDNVVCDNNRRNGLSIVSVKGLNVKNSQFINTNGTDPQAGIDFEPNSPDMFLENIVLDNVYLKNNNKRGLFFCLWLMFGDQDSSPVKNVSIVLNDVRSEGDTNGFETVMSNFTGNVDPSTDRLEIKNLNGEIVLNNCEAKNSKKNGIRLYRWFDVGLKITFNNIKIINPNGEKGTSLENNAAVCLFDPTGSTTPSTYRLGGVEINNLEVTHASDDPLKRSIAVNDIKNQNKAKNLTIRNTKKINGTVLFGQSLDETCKVVDNNEAHKLIDPVSRPVEKGREFYKIISNKGATGTVTKTLNALNYHNEEITFINEENQSYVIKCFTGNTFLPFNTTQYTLTGIGSKITVKRFNDTSWIVTNLFGNYTAL